MKQFYLLTLVVLALFTVSCSDDGSDVPPVDPPKTEWTYYIVSDTHLGDSRSIDDKYGWNLSMKDTLSAFLDYLAENDDWDELIFDGDMTDEWICPPSYTTFADKTGNLLTEKEFFNEIVKANSKIFEQLYELKLMGKKLVFVPGNHDMQVTEDDLDSVLPGLFEVGNPDQYVGLGDYSPDDNISIEHGHRYDIFNSPYIGKVGIDDIPEGSILPPGFFVSRLGAGSRLEDATKTKSSEFDIFSLITDENGYNLYWDVIALLYGIEDVVTMVDGMTKDYCFLEYARNSAKLFKNIDKYDEPNDGWNKRCERNGAKFIPTIRESILSCFEYDYFDAMGLRILDENPGGPRILVMGHTHEPELYKTDDGTGIYLNTGCWVDTDVAVGKENTSTFGKITHKKSDTENTYEVSICRFDIDSYGTPVVTTLKKESL